jgi:hypothetical protein
LLKKHYTTHSTSDVPEIRASSIKCLQVCNDYSKYILGTPAKVAFFLDMKISPKKRAEHREQVLEVLRKSQPMEESVEVASKRNVSKEIGDDTINLYDDSDEDDDEAGADSIESEVNMLLMINKLDPETVLTDWRFANRFARS